MSCSSAEDYCLDARVAEITDNWNQNVHRIFLTNHVDIVSRTQDGRGTYEYCTVLLLLLASQTHILPGTKRSVCVMIEGEACRRTLFKADVCVTFVDATRRAFSLSRDVPCDLLANRPTGDK